MVSTDRSLAVTTGDDAIVDEALAATVDSGRSIAIRRAVATRSIRDACFRVWRDSMVRLTMNRALNGTFTTARLAPSGAT